MAQASSPKGKHNPPHALCEDAVKQIGTQCVSRDADIAVIR